MHRFNPSFSYFRLRVQLLPPPAFFPFSFQRRESDFFFFFLPRLDAIPLAILPPPPEWPKPLSLLPLRLQLFTDLRPLDMGRLRLDWDRLELVLRTRELPALCKPLRRIFAFLLISSLPKAVLGRYLLGDWYCDPHWPLFFERACDKDWADALPCILPLPFCWCAFCR